MKHDSKKQIPLLFALALTVFLCACGASGGNATRSLQLGGSSFYVTIPSSFKEDVMSLEEIADDQVGRYNSDESKLSFDVYQFSKEGYPDALVDFITQEAEEYDASEVVTDAYINGVAVGCYRAVEERDEAPYDTITYAFENGKEYVEIVFWLDGEQSASEAADIINSLMER